MSSPLNPKTLTRDQQDALIEACFDSTPLFHTAKKIGFKDMSGLTKYINKNPAFKAEIEQAKLDGCKLLEDELIHIAKNYSGAKAKIIIDTICKVLAFRQPAVYGQRIDMNINKTVSIQHNLINANSRVIEILKTATTAKLVSS